MRGKHLTSLMKIENFSSSNCEWQRRTSEKMMTLLDHYEMSLWRVLKERKRSEGNVMPPKLY